MRKIGLFFPRNHPVCKINFLRFDRKKAKSLRLEPLLDVFCFFSLFRFQQLISVKTNLKVNFAASFFYTIPSAYEFLGQSAYFSPGCGPIGHVYSWYPCRWLFCRCHFCLGFVYFEQVFKTNSCRINFSGYRRNNRAFLSGYQCDNGLSCRMDRNSRFSGRRFLFCSFF